MKNFGDITNGILAMLLSALFFSVMNAFVKILSSDLSSMQIMFFRSIVMVLLIIILLPISPIKRTYKKGKWGQLLIRAFAGGLSMLAIFYNISTINLGVAMAFSQSMPLFIVLYSFIFVRSSINFSNIIASIIGFLGIILISDPTFSHIPLLNILLGIFSAIGMAIAFISLKSLKGYFDPKFIILTFGVTMSIVPLALMLIEFSLIPSYWKNPSLSEWLYIILLGITGTLGQHFLTKAYLLAPAGIVAPIDYTRILFSLVLGILLGDNIPNISILSGMALIIISGLLISLPPFLSDLRALKYKS